MGKCKQCNLKRIKALYEERKAAREKAERIALIEKQSEKQEPQHELVAEELPKKEKAGRRKKKEVLVEMENFLTEELPEKESLNVDGEEPVVESKPVQEIMPEEMVEVPEVVIEQAE